MEGEICVNDPTKCILTNDTFSKRGTFEGGQPQISYLDGADGAGDENVVTLEVPVDDGRSARVQKVKPFEDLTTPALQQLQLHLLEPLQVPKTKEDKTKHSVPNMQEEKKIIHLIFLTAKRKF